MPISAAHSRSATSTVSPLTTPRGRGALRFLRLSLPFCVAGRALLAYFLRPAWMHHLTPPVFFSPHLRPPKSPRCVAADRRIHSPASQGQRLRGRRCPVLRLRPSARGNLPPARASSGGCDRGEPQHRCQAPLRSPGLRPSSRSAAAAASPCRLAGRIVHGVGRRRGSRRRCRGSPRE